MASVLPISEAFLKYVAGQIDADYLNALEAKRKDSAKA